MSRDLAIIVKCDKCGASLDESTPTTRVGVTPPVVKAAVEREGDLCDDCNQSFAELVGSFLELCAEYLPLVIKGGGGKKGSAPRIDDDLESESNRTCPVCQHVSASRSALGQHVSFKHSTTLAKLGISHVGRKVRKGSDA